MASGLFDSQLSDEICPVGEGIYRWPLLAAQARGQSFAAQYQRDFMHQRVCLARIGGTVPELGELGLETGMRGDVDVWR